jgi:hypothetical protein
MAKYGVSEEQQLEVHAIITEMVARADHGDMPSFTEFEERVLSATGGRGDRAFIELLVEALRIERPDAAALYEHFTRAMPLLRV